MGTSRIDSRRKGAAGEREFIKEFEEVFKIKMKRNYDQYANGGDDFVVDIIDSPISEYVDRKYSIECKRRRKINLSDRLNFWSQACCQAEAKSKIPIVVYREDYGQWRVMFPLLWYTDRSLDGTAEMSIIGFYRWVKFELRNIEGEKWLI